jgi:Arylsulfotransferase (ASST)
MKTLRGVLAVCLIGAFACSALAAPSVYPTGVTQYDPQRSWNGYTVLTLLREPGLIMIDMNGRVVKQWAGFDNSAGGPARLFPGGRVVAAAGNRPGHQESLRLQEQDFAGVEGWRLEGDTSIESTDGGTIRSLRQHHDWQRSDYPAGYFSPASHPRSDSDARTLVLTHVNHTVANVSPLPLEDDRLIEFDARGRVTWQWTAADHVDELGFSPAARAAISAGVGARRGPRGRGNSATASSAGDGSRGFDWLHTNSATYLGPNHWYDAGDKRFAPDNVLISSRQGSLLAIVARDGSVVWRIGPDFRESPALAAIGQIIGQHNAHLIPVGLPGAGNLLVFDNGGQSGYGFDSPISRNGYGGLARATSRVLEIDPVKLELVWSYAPASGFFATNISSAQRLPNGNTLITEGPDGRLIEVTAEGKIIWEYINPFFVNNTNSVYRAYRVPYDWVPQAPKPEERPVTPPPLGEFHLGDTAAR